MATEIERKFLVKTSNLPDDLSVFPMSNIRQGYLLTKPVVRARTRIRWVQSDYPTREGFITIKGSGLIKRLEFEFRIPFWFASWLISLCSLVISKDRFELGRWEVDRFDGTSPENWLAEIELDSESERFGMPTFVGREVTYDKRYNNMTLSKDGFPSDHVQE
jgi:adenylate cyclase